ncbi:HEAT repeat domain-containing protein [Candidatus Omnitrophota bacterium]
MQTIHRYVRLGVIFGFILFASFSSLADGPGGEQEEVLGGHPSDWGDADDLRAPARNHRYGVVENKSSFPVIVQLDSTNQEFHFLDPGEQMVVPAGTREVDVQRSSSMPLDGSERLNVEVRVGEESLRSGNVTRVTGFGDTVRLDTPTGGFSPSQLRSDTRANILPGAAYPEDRTSLNLRRLDNSNSEVRALGASNLGQAGNRDAVEPLLRALRDDNESVRYDAAESLGEIGDPRAVGAITERLTTENSYAQAAMIRSLGKMGNQESVRALEQTLRSPDAMTRLGTINALKASGGPDAARAIRSALTDSDIYVRDLAVSALGDMGGTENMGPLERVLRNDSSGDVRRRAAQALGKIGDVRSLDALSRAMNDSDSSVRINAIRATEEIGGERASRSIANALNDSSSYVRQSAIRSLGRIGDESSLNSLAKILKSPNEDDRSRAARALGSTGNANAVALLNEALTDESPEVRRYAANSLGELGGEEAFNALEAARNDKDPDVRRSAERSLRDIEERRAGKAKQDQTRREASRDPRLVSLNEAYMEDTEMLKKLDPNSEEARARRHRLEVTEEQIRDIIKEEERTHGGNWIDRYRDMNDRLPGGLLDDPASRLSKLRDVRGGQQRKVDDLKKRFEQLRRGVDPVAETWQQRLLRDQRAFREEFIRENGLADGWNDATKRRYEREFNALTAESRRRWDQDRARVGENNRELGRTINELARARNDLAETDRDIAREERAIAARREVDAAVDRGQAEKAGKTRELGGLPEGAALEGAEGMRVSKIAGYAVDKTDNAIGAWNSEYPHPSFDDEAGRSGLPNGTWDGAYYFKGDTLYLVIENLAAQYPPLHTLGVGYTVTLDNATFEDGSVTKDFILYEYSGAPGETRIIKGFKVVPRR